jgi:hypothetical protein
LAGIQSATPLRVIRSLIGETGAKRNGNGIYLTAGGSSTTIDKNVIGGNEIGIIVQAGVDGLTITGNMIGVESDGVTPRRNTIAGIEVIGAKNILIGGTTVAARNVISGNGDGGGVAGDGILVTTADHLTIAGNYVGLAASGAAPVLPPQAFGIVVSDTTNSVIGGTDPAARNVVSGNSIGGIAVVGSSDHVEVLNNFVGVDAAGALAIPSGTGITAGGSNIVVGRTGSGNVVAGGTVTFFSTGNGVTSAIRGSGLIQANLIGLDATGLNILHNGGAGIETRLSADLLIDGNTIAGSGSDGIRLSGSAPSFLSTGIVIQRNRIGTNVSGGPAPNAGSGIHIASDATGNTIGMTNSASQANTIMFNGGAGVVVEGNATGNAIRANGIDQNGALGIDLGADGVTFNDAGDADTGPNTAQNFPVIDTATTAGGTTTIIGSLDSTANATFVIDFFSSPASDPAGFGEGRAYLGSATVVTNGAGHAAFFQVLAAASPGSVATATATGAGGTSEFSKAVSVAVGQDIPVFGAGSLIVLVLALTLLALRAIAREPLL